MNISDWVAADKGGPAPEPELQETPAPEPVEVVDETPAEQEVAAAEQEVQRQIEMLEARLGDEPYSIPENILVPQKRGKDIEYVPLKEALADGMRQRDYTIKTQEAASLRRALENERLALTKEQARLRADREALLEERKQMLAASKDPEQYEKTLGHLERYTSDPDYAKVYDEALEARVLRADKAAADEEAAIAEALRAAEQALGWLEELAAEEAYALVDSERVRVQYAQALQQGAELSSSEMRKFFEAERKEVDRVREAAVKPVQKQLDDLQAQIAKLEESAKAGRHNATVEAAIKRAKAPNVVPVTSQPATANDSERKQWGPNDREAAIQHWVRGG